MDNLVVKITFSGAYITVTFLSWFAHRAIIKYHRNKPPGMQSILTTVTILWSQTCILGQAAICLEQCLTEFLGPLAMIPAGFLAFLELYAAQVMMMAFLIEALTKLTIIAHGSLIGSLNEESLTKRLKLILVFTPIALIVFEMGYLSSFEDLSAFQTKHLGGEPD